MKFLTALIAAAFIAAPARAQQGHKHDEHKPKYGGIVKEVNEVQYELIAKPDRITLFVEDHGKKVETKGATGKVTLRTGSDRKEVVLQPAGDNKLEAAGTFNIAAGTVAIAQVKLAGKPEQGVRFTLK